ncbi:microbial collagenase [Hamadaea flava]|uniref:microbial collagenase n=1 Tax=Hamadaea flava TaxID=1742688 RepID=A0ABV8LME5_9ACTN|nr:collagenase [Hamadaea flava]MCP2324072.1 microbial collagenase [Hamadaea flava]
MTLPTVQAPIPAAAGPAPQTSAATAHGPAPSAASTGSGSAHVRSGAQPIQDRAPRPATTDAVRQSYDNPQTTPRQNRPSTARSSVTAAAACNVADFTSRTGSALVQQIKASTTDCVNTLFTLTGSDAYYAFREAQMAGVAYGFRDNAGSYAGDNATGTAQLVLYLRAGYYVQYYNASTVGSYGVTLQTAIRAGLDAFFANGHSGDVNDANGETLAEAVTLIDSAVENARYIYFVKRLLANYTNAYNAYWWMRNAVNNVFTVTFRGHQVPAFVSAVQSDPSLIDSLYNFASAHRDLLGTDNSFLTSNAGRELGRFLQHTALQSRVRPLALGLLGISAITGTTAPLWVGVAEMTDYYDQANCAYYGTCDLAARLASAVLTVTYACGSSITIKAQDMTSSQLSASCTSLTSQDAYFHSVVADSGAVANDYNTDIEVVVFDSSTDYQTYAGAMYGIDTNNGGMYLEGDPANSANQARFIAYEAEWVRPAFEIWNLNHEYTHYLDGRFDMYGDFSAGVTTPTIWWIEGFAEYISYSYRNVAYDAAIAEAATGTYALSTLFDTTYSNDTTRIYRWGYLAVRYLLQSHRSDMTTVLNYYRSGNWTAARTYLTSTIGTRYNADWYTWLAACAAGACGGSTPTNNPPTASFTTTTSGLTATFTDRSTDSDGTVASRRWTFGDGTSSTATNPSKTYAAAGAYTVTLTVTDDDGATGTTSATVTVGGGGGMTECTNSDVRQLDRNCRRSNLSATTGNYSYLYIYLPAGVSRLTITASGGSGNADLYYNSSSWATTSSYTSRSTAGGNTESLTITNPPAGYNYISLYAVSGFSAVTVATQY